MSVVLNCYFNCIVGEIVHDFQPLSFPLSLGGQWLPSVPACSDADQWIRRSCNNQSLTWMLIKGVCIQLCSLWGLLWLLGFDQCIFHMVKMVSERWSQSDIYDEFQRLGDGVLATYEYQKSKQRIIRKWLVLICCRRLYLGGDQRPTPAKPWRNKPG